MLTEVTKRLASLGYTVNEADNWILRFCIQRVENHIKDSCNILSIPDGLYQAAVDMAAGSFLFEKKAADAKSLAGIDLDTAVKQIQEGDTSVTFALGEGSTTPEQRLDALISWLMTYGEKDLVSYRCFKW